MIRRLRKAGISWVCIHGRTREQRKSETKECNFDIIRSVKANIKDIPVFANGGCETLEDVYKCLEYTKCDAYMAAESLLGNPAMFLSKAEQPHPMIMTQDYLEMCKKYKSVTRHMIRGHVFKLLYRELTICTTIRCNVGVLREPYLHLVCEKICTHRQQIGENNFEKLLVLAKPWYFRFRNHHMVLQAEKTQLLEYLVKQIDLFDPSNLTSENVVSVINQ